jgi:hypothetical protein
MLSVGDANVNVENIFVACRHRNAIFHLWIFSSGGKFYTMLGNQLLEIIQFRVESACFPENLGLVGTQS